MNYFKSIATATEFYHQSFYHVPLDIYTNHLSVPVKTLHEEKLGHASEKLVYVLMVGKSMALFTQMGAYTCSLHSDLSCKPSVRAPRNCHATMARPDHITPLMTQSFLFVRLYSGSWLDWLDAETWHNQGPECSRKVRPDIV